MSKDYGLGRESLAKDIFQHISGRLKVDGKCMKEDIEQKPQFRTCICYKEATGKNQFFWENPKKAASSKMTVQREKVRGRLKIGE